MLFSFVCNCIIHRGWYHQSICICSSVQRNVERIIHRRRRTARTAGSKTSRCHCSAGGGRHAAASDEALKMPLGVLPRWGVHVPLACTADTRTASSQCEIQQTTAAAAATNLFVTNSSEIPNPLSKSNQNPIKLSRLVLTSKKFRMRCQKKKYSARGFCSEEALRCKPRCSRSRRPGRRWPCPWPPPRRRGRSSASPTTS